MWGKEQKLDLKWIKDNVFSEKYKETRKKIMKKIHGMIENVN